MAKRLQPLVKSYVEYIAAKEPMAYLADGTVYVENIIEQILPRKILDKFDKLRRINRNY